MLFARDITKTNKQKHRKLENNNGIKIYIHTHNNKLQNKTLIERIKRPRVCSLNTLIQLMGLQ